MFHGVLIAQSRISSAQNHWHIGIAILNPADYFKWARIPIRHLGSNQNYIGLILFFQFCVEYFQSYTISTIIARKVFEDIGFFDYLFVVLSTAIISDFWRVYALQLQQFRMVSIKTIYESYLITVSEQNASDVE